MIFTKVQYQHVAQHFFIELILWHVSAWLASHLQGVFCGICSVCFNVCIRIFTSD